jgi:hypothetical protein
MSCCDHDAREHLKKAGEHLHEAARTWSDRLVDPQVKSHLRDAARSALHAGLAAIDAAERRAQARNQPAAPATPAQPA